MRIKKVFNNNVLLAEQQGHEVVLIGKGLGFQKKTGEIVDEHLVTKTYTPTADNWLANFQSLMSDIEPDYFELTSEIIDLAEKQLQTKFNGYLLISLTDHIHFAVYRHQHQMDIKNEILWEIKRIYHHEYEVGHQALALIAKRFQVQLPDDEAGFIAMKFVENSMADSNGDQTVAMTKLINDILNIVKYQLSLTMSEESLSLQRFLVHLRFFAERLTLKQADKSAGTEDEFLFEHVSQKYPRAFACVEKIVAFIQTTTAQPVSMNEQIYLTIHIQRMLNEAQ
ncbi:PRD domain-containing protein [Lactiplantibacillus sp. WILCCON 0030]|uniref:PRD domain-containing protein n=1 Tax=Lactiplantibacillus brownii TaxID=3069269 RepID=A0ABU1ABI4_9LACO|nr:PRD domain-containing protein [Lactiplantibacillus brownii]MDQ7938327.1 PRD domain-containing protein [Lactiplantibacillus brownii]